MGWQNPDVPWSELEGALSGRAVTGSSLRGGPEEGDGGDSPAWSAHRGPYEPPEGLRPAAAGAVPYAELHCHSHFSFLDGASSPEELVERAAELGLEAVALTDHDGMYGVVRFAEAARALGMRTVFGAELSLGLSAPQAGVADPEGEHLLLLARGPSGYRALCRTISAAQMRGGEKGRPVYDLDEVVADTAGAVVVLTGCRKGAVRRALDRGGPAAAAVALENLAQRFGREHVRVELTAHGDPCDTERNDALAALAAAAGIGTVATTAAHYATPDRAPLAATVAAVRARRGLDEIDPWLPVAGTAHLRSGAEMALRFDDRYPGAVARAAELGRELAFELHLVAPDLPPFDVPPGETEATWLRKLTRIGVMTRYGSEAEHPFAAHTVQRELAIIEQKNFPGYFLIVHDIVDFCRRSGIFCQGRGSAANSAVCYALGITNVDAVRHGLLFERFLSPDRDGYPDIDLDIESGRREEAIQYVYRRYGRLFAAQVANVITYRPRSAVRDTARALGFSPGQQDAWSKRVERWHALEAEALPQDMPDRLVELAGQLMGAPRHLGIHSGGMVICDRPVSEVVPVEWARMADRTVVQWDKEDCASAGLVKFDLLGLGMLTALHLMVDLVARHDGTRIELHEIGESDPEVYAMLSRADSVGVFQVESRAQMATLPRLRPREFYDLVVEVALIRPGPIQGGSVHPYIRRRNGLEDWEHDHELLKPALDKTLGIPLFQEQMMQIAVDVAGFSAAEADELRRAMGAKRSTERMERLRDRFFDGMAANGITGELASRIFTRMLAFANFGFPESHSISFAALVYYSAWFKRYHPAAFCAALLNAQPMGFYSPQSLVADARRHGVLVRGPDVNSGGADAILQAVGEDEPESTGGWAIRLGLSGIRTIGSELAGVIEAERAAAGSFADLADLARRVRLTGPQAEALATAGAFGCFGVDRREALWAAGVVAGVRPEHLPGTAVGLAAPALPGMTEAELTVSDVWATGVSPDSHPVQHLRAELDALGAVRIDRLDAVGRREQARRNEHQHRSGPDAPPRVLVGGLVTHRQRPATAGGVTFVNLEDESGMLNVTCSEGLWARYRSVALGSAALLVRGRLERSPEGVLNLLADRLQRMPLAVTVRSRDFR
ncbi:MULTISPECIES: error-prone DNA polymerase [Pseudonocardia]|uniref:Error-prone DNA polymerase n=1 Tax=Pseudonocardia saturnea TaxID=33909 RepID=A0ABQ0S4N3_9PSEU|nr:MULTISPECIES: error-prone DNA polymerase [Pseudonocardia]BBG04528.1 error-prone DNA polymerase [Pseudonocardia autotrophica]GEC27888.1 error-prone DNA polymerase [Pseudonocardia saturnea]